MTKQEFRVFIDSALVLGMIILVIPIYYFGIPFFSKIGLGTHWFDGFFQVLSNGGYLSAPWKTKIASMFIVGVACVAKTGSSKDTEWYKIIVFLIVGHVIYYIYPKDAGIYVLTTVAGTALCATGFSWLGRKFGHRQQNTDANETFDQCRELMENEYSVNLPHKFFYQKKWNDGWINVVNPFRATMVLGTPGSGKSYSVYNPFIEQMVKKGYAMFVYDFKFPDLSEIVYNTLLENLDCYDKPIEFHVINFDDPTLSNRCNPINPRYMFDPADSTEVADIVMDNVNQGKKEGSSDFFDMSAKVYLDALVWFLRIYEGGKFCDFPHVIELMGANYEQVFDILKEFPSLAVKIGPFKNALDAGAADQLQGQIASAQIPLNKFVSPALYWVLSGNDFDLDMNNPEHPKIVCIGNNPDRQSIYGTTLALFTSRMIKLINHKHKRHCSVLLDELPTIKIKGLDNLIATARSNKVAVVLGAQDKSQLSRDYGDKEAEVIFNTVGTIFSGQVNGKTAEEFSKTFGKEFREQVSKSEGDSESQTFSLQQLDILPASTIETLSQGTFFGKVADNFGQEIDKKLFCGKIQIDNEAYKARSKKWGKMPQFTDFFGRPDEEIPISDSEREVIRKALTQAALKRDLEEGKISHEDEFTPPEFTEKEIIQAFKKKYINKMVNDNFTRIKDDIRNLIETCTEEISNSPEAFAARVKRYEEMMI